MEKCEYCNDTFERLTEFPKHMKEVHDVEKPFKCKICDSAFSENRRLNLHIAIAHKEKKPVLDCEICGLKFDRKIRLKKHILKFHLGEEFINDEFPEGLNQFKCQTCDNTFSEVTEFTKHIEEHGIDI